MTEKQITAVQEAAEYVEKARAIFENAFCVTRRNNGAPYSTLCKRGDKAKSKYHCPIDFPDGWRPE